jgi:UDP-GlcNAc:undecaprenyl-phosphate GlcNAc-1-phosphate transferase
MTSDLFLFEGLLLPSLLATLLGTVLAIRWLIDRAQGLGLLDAPGGRKQHAKPTPLVGGLGIGFGLLVIWLLVPSLRPHPWLIVGFVGVLVVGAVDDYREIPASRKLGIEIALIAGVLSAAGVTLDHLDTLLPGVEVHVGWLGLPVAVFGIASVMNAVNMIDGVDGLAGGVAFVGFASLALLAGVAGETSLMQMALIPCAAIAGFLGYNLRLPGRPAARVFLGDAGSLSVGFLLGAYAIIICQSSSVPAIATVWAVALPLLDGLTVIQRRSARGVGITQPGADHLHHLLRASGLSPTAITAAETLLAAVFAAIGIALWQVDADEWVSLLLLLIMALAFRVVSDRAWRRLSQPRDKPQRDGQSREQSRDIRLDAEPDDTPVLATGSTGDSGSLTQSIEDSARPPQRRGER